MPKEAEVMPEQQHEGMALVHYCNVGVRLMQNGMIRSGMQHQRIATALKSRLDCLISCD
jgi:hypothetical protein